MHKNNLMAFAAALLLVGAGCSSSGDASLNTSLNTNATNAPVETRSDSTGGLQLDGEGDTSASADADAGVTGDVEILAPDTVDASIDALLEDSEEEITAEGDLTVELEAASGDAAEVNAYGQASYETE